MPNGTMKQTEAICRAIAWAASSFAPMRPMSKAAALKIVTSNAIVRPIGNADAPERAVARPVGPPEAAEEVIAPQLPVED